MKKAILSIVAALPMMSALGANQLYGLAGPTTSGGTYSLIQVDPNTAGVNSLFTFVLASGPQPDSLTFDSDAGVFLMSRSSVTGGSLIVLDPQTQTAHEVPITGLPSGQLSIGGIGFDPVSHQLLLSFGNTNSVLQNRIATLDLTGVAHQFSSALNVTDIDYLAYDPFHQQMDLVDLNSTTGVRSITNIFGTPVITQLAPPADPNSNVFSTNLHSPTFSASGQLYVASLSSQPPALYTLSGNSYSLIHNFLGRTDVLALGFGPDVLQVVRADPNLSHRADPILSQGW